jgi:hypothetical protein
MVGFRLILVVVLLIVVGMPRGWLYNPLAGAPKRGSQYQVPVIN